MPFLLKKTVVSVSKNGFKLIINKYTEKALHFEVRNLKNTILNRNLATSKCDDFLILVIQKKEEAMWRQLFIDMQSADNTKFYINRKSKLKTSGKKPSERNFPRLKRLRKKTGVIRESGKGMSNVPKTVNMNVGDISELSIENFKSQKTQPSTKSSFIITKQNRNKVDRCKSIEHSLLEEVDKAFSKSVVYKERQANQDNYKSNPTSHLRKPPARRISKIIVSSRLNKANKEKVPLFKEKSVNNSIILNPKRKSIIPKAVQNSFIKKQAQKRKSVVFKKKRQSVARSLNADNKSVNSFNDVEGISKMRATDHSMKINRIQKEILEMFSNMKLDIGWIKQEFKILQTQKDKLGAFVEFQHKVNKILIMKLAKERTSRMRTEKQFGNLTSKFAEQQDLLERSLIDELE